MNRWIKEIRGNADPHVLIYLLGNKTDIEEKREVKLEDAQKWASENGVHRVFESSAKSGFNVDEIFSLAGKELFYIHAAGGEKTDPATKPINIADPKPKTKKKGGCCK